MSITYVQDKNGQPLMPTTRSGWVYRALRDGKAKVVSKCPFTIKLLYETKTKEVQPLTLGVDTGSKHVGTAVIKDDTSEVVYESQVELRDDIKQKMNKRRQFRRARRNKLRYRPPRFDNRKASKRKDRYSPTLMSKFQGHKREIEFIQSILPINKMIFEVGEFDPHLMQDPSLAYRKWGYQKGELYKLGNFKQATKARDNYECQNCGKKTGTLEVHHLLPSSRGGSDKLENLITLCPDCHHLAHSSEEQLLKFQKKFGKKAKGQLKYATQMNVLRNMLVREYPEAELTYGFITKEIRRVLNLEKSHMTDACCIASHGILFDDSNTNKYKKKCVAKGDYPRTGVKHGKFTILPEGKIAGFRRFDKVEYENKKWFVSGRESVGRVTLTNIDGEYLKVERIKRKTGEKYMSQAHINSNLVKKVSSVKSCICTQI